MKTYPSYEAAKIANPESNIYVLGGKFQPGHEAARRGEEECNPADHCMTVEQFLKTGYKFVEGDIFIDDEGDVETVGGLNFYDPSGASQPHEDDHNRYVLRAAALEEKPKRTKFEYVKCEFNFAWEAVKAFEDDEEFYTHFMSDGWVAVKHVQQVIPNLQVEKLYRRIETEISERDEFIEAVSEILPEFDKRTTPLWIGKLYDSGKLKLVEGE